MAAGNKNGTLAFDRYRLDVANLMLYRDGIELSVAPKIAKTLSVLVENAGTIITKDELIERVWDDSIVEESNLTQYLYILRKTLGNMSDGRPYIETLRRRGYRFNGEVERVADARPLVSPVSRTQPEQSISSLTSGVERDGNVLRVVDWQAPEPLKAQPSAELESAPVQVTPREANRTKSALPRLAIGAACLLLIGVGGIFLWPRLMPAAMNAESQRELSITRLTNGLMPNGATISQDGNVFIYSEVEGETSHLYAQQTGQASRIEIESSTERLFGAKAFSPDGQLLYYTAIDKKSRASSIYRIPSMGGASVKLVDDVHGSVAISPDGKEIAYCRRNPNTSDTTLMIANQDGRAERVVLQRKAPSMFAGSVAWSPDGKLISFGELKLGGLSGSQHLFTVDVATGRTAPFSAEGWDNILQMLWSPDGSGIVMIGTRDSDGYSTRRDQVYFVSYPAGVSRRVTNDGNRHEPGSLGITKKGEILAVPSNRSCQIWQMNADGNASSAIQLTKGVGDGRAGLAPLPDGRFGYLARTAEEINLMLSNSDATNVKQIATGFQFIEELRPDPLGRFLVFSSMKDGRNHMFRVDVDGRDVKQLTSGDGREIDSTISPDGKHLVYDSAVLVDGVETYALKRVPMEGGEPTTIKARGCFIPTYSPDGSMVSCVSNETPEIIVVSATDGSEIERHPLPVNSSWNFGIGWTPDGSGLIYVLTENGTSNLWIQPRDRSKPRSMTNFSSGIIYRYAFSTDASKLFVARGYPTQDVILIRNFH